MARAWAALPQKPRRSALFLAVTAEEGGLKGSEYYATHPLIPPSKTALDLNYDALYPWGRARDVVITGAERTTVYALAQQIARRLNLAISEDAQPEAGHYFPRPFLIRACRSLRFRCACDRVCGKPRVWHQGLPEYNSQHYHQPSDEFQEDWDSTALQQAAEYGFLLGRDVANQDQLPGGGPGTSSTGEGIPRKQRFRSDAHFGHGFRVCLRRRYQSGPS
jgi:hypothetical protein